MQNVQIFGVRNSSATRAAERFFKERRIPLHLVDLKAKAMAAGEIRRFIEKFTLPGLLDTAGKPYEDAGLKYLKVSDAALLQKIEAEPRLLRLPLVRGGNRIAVRFAYEWHDADGKWYRSYGNENWQFDENGLMQRRIASINDLAISEQERKYHWPQGRRPDDHPGLTELGL